MIYQSLEKVLAKFGIQEISDFSVFNPKYHEALVQVESDKHKSGRSCAGSSKRIHHA